MKPRLLTGLVLGASLLGGVASAAPFIASFEAHDDMHAGALWRNDRPNNNNQRGAGAEHQAITRVGNNIVVVSTASYTDVTPMITGAGLSSLQAGLTAPTDGDPGVNPGNSTRVEGLCTSYKIDPVMGLVKTNQAYFTNNKSPDWQNAHKMATVAINGGQAALVLYGYDPNGNRTRINGRVLGPNCEIMSNQTQLFASNNDDYGGAKVASDVIARPDGSTSTAFCHIGNGNGDDDGWCGLVNAKLTGTGATSYTLTPEAHFITETNEERTRPEVSATSIPNMYLACWSQGNDQPTDNVRCGMFDVSQGVPDGQRVQWRQLVAKRTGAIHFTSPTLVPVLDAAGKSTDKFLVSYVKVDTTNRNGRTKGRTAIQTVPIQVTAKGFTMLDTPKENLFGIGDGSHPGMLAGTYGADNRPVAFLFAGNVTDGGTANTKIIGLTADNKLEAVRAINWADATSGGHTSQWYGHNPNTPQGRSYPVAGLTIANPGFGQTGGYQPDVKSFLVLANVYHKDHAGGCIADPNKGTNNGTCGGKNALGVVLVPVAANATTGSNPTDPNDPTPVDPTHGGSNSSESGTTLGGCSTTGGAGAGSLLLLGLAACFIRRRRTR